MKSSLLWSDRATSTTRHLVRAVNRQPGLPRGMTRRAPSAFDSSPQTLTLGNQTTPAERTLPEKRDDASESRKPLKNAATRKMSKNRTVFATPGHTRNLSPTRKFAQGMELNQRMHFWMSQDLRKARKLLRSETNSQILRNLVRAVNRQLGARGKPSTWATARDDS